MLLPIRPRKEQPMADETPSDPEPAPEAPPPRQDAAPTEPVQPLQDFVPQPGLKDFTPKPAMRGGQEPPGVETTAIDPEFEARITRDPD